jgi:hypothetical protein
VRRPREPDKGPGEEATMNRTTGTGSLTLGLVLGVVGAIMRFAVHVHTSGFNVHVAGVILLIVGIVSALIGAAMMIAGNRTRSTTEEFIQRTPSGELHTEERTNTSV